jgi:serine/threonine-protein kinase
MGTVGYMSPEQVRGLAVDHRSDIFSFGAILYEMLSGHRAFKKDTAGDTMASILRDEPAELSQSGRVIPVALDHIVRHCLEKDRDSRFQSARDIAFALSEASGATSAVTSGSQIVAAATPPRRKSGVWIAAAVVAIAAIVVVLLLRRPHAGGPVAGGVKRVAVLPFENLASADDDYFADGIADQIRGKLAALPGVEVIARASSTPYKKTTKTPKQIAEELNAGYLLTATVRWQKSGGASRVQVSPELVDVTHPDSPMTKWQQPFDASLTDVFQVQSDIATKVADSLGVALGEGQRKQLSDKPTQNLAAYDAFLKGVDAWGGGARVDPMSSRRALAFFDQAAALDPSFALAWASISSACAILYINGVPSPELSERARQAADKAIELDPKLPDGYRAKGGYERGIAGDPAGAIREYEKGLKIAPEDSNLLRALSQAELTLGHWEKSLDYLRQAQRLDPRNLSSVRSYGDALLRLRRTREAKEVLERSLAMQPQNVSSVEYLAMAFLSDGDLAGARGIIAAAKKNIEPTALVAYLAQYNDLAWVLDESDRDLVLRLTPSAFDNDRASWALYMAQVHALRGDQANVRKYADEARQEQLRETPNDDQRHVLRGVALAYLGRKDEAIAEAQRGIALDPVSKDALGGPYDVHQLARIYVLVGEPEKAIDQLEALLKIPYYLSPGWLKIDPNFDPLRNNPRFQKLVAGAK